MSRLRRPGRAQLTLLLAAVAVALLLGCTGSGEEDLTPTPVPTPVEEPPPAPSGRDITVVLPPSDQLDDAVAEALHRRLAALSTTLPDGVAGLTIRRPDTRPFVVDLAELAALDGSGLVCLVGPDTAGATDTLARRHRGVRFCGLPTALPQVDEEGALPVPPAVRVELPVAELGRLVGVAAAEVVAAVSDGPVVGLALGGDELPVTALRDGLLRGLAGVEVIEVDDPAATPDAVVDTLLAAGADVIVLDGHRGAGAVAAAVGDRAVLIGPVDVVDAADPGVALAYRLRHEVALATVFDSFATGTLGEVPVLLGVADDVLDLRIGAAWPELAPVLERERRALVQRDDPRAPVPDGPGPGEPVGP